MKVDLQKSLEIVYSIMREKTFLNTLSSRLSMSEVDLLNRLHALTYNIDFLRGFTNIEYSTPEDLYKKVIDYCEYYIRYGKILNE